MCMRLGDGEEEGGGRGGMLVKPVWIPRLASIAQPCRPMNTSVQAREWCGQVWRGLLAQASGGGLNASFPTSPKPRTCTSYSSILQARALQLIQDARLTTRHESTQANADALDRRSREAISWEQNQTPYVPAIHMKFTVNFSSPISTKMFLTFCALFAEVSMWISPLSSAY